MPSRYFEVFETNDEKILKKALRREDFRYMKIVLNVIKLTVPKKEKLSKEISYMEVRYRENRQNF